MISREDVRKAVKILTNQSLLRYRSVPDERIIHCGDVIEQYLTQSPTEEVKSVDEICEMCNDFFRNKLWQNRVKYDKEENTFYVMANNKHFSKFNTEYTSFLSNFSVDIQYEIIKFFKEGSESE